MYRIKDNYNWKKLRHWKTVIEKGDARWRGGGNACVDSSALELAMVLLLNDCFPISIVCCCMDDGKKEILATPLWESIFSFLNNERQIKWDGCLVYFKEMEAEEKQAILDAYIFSIWLKEGKRVL